MFSITNEQASYGFIEVDWGDLNPARVEMSPAKLLFSWFSKLLLFKWFNNQ